MRLHREAMLELADAIVSGELAPGARIPKETALTEQFDISRGVARECLRGLEERGLVTVKHGSATTVNPREKWELFDADVIAVALGGAAAVALLGDYLECRRMIEIGSAGLAAVRAKREHVARLEDRLDNMRAAVAQRSARVQEREYHAADVAFHLTLVEATGNGALVSLVRRIDGALLAARYPLARPAYRRTRAIPEHEAILEAVRARDERAARDAMRAHLDTVEQYLHEHAQRVARAA
jgi:DNA-binding FadR family transcriptional regulator